jgi:hypothetical protein
MAEEGVVREKRVGYCFWQWPPTTDIRPEKSADPHVLQ